MERIHQVEDNREELLLDLDEIARAGARRMLAEALEAEVADYIEAARDQRDENGHAWSFAMGVPESARSSWEPGLSKSVLRGLTTEGWTRMVIARGLRA